MSRVELVAKTEKKPGSRSGSVYEGGDIIKALVSIAILTYNRGELVSRALRSVLAQETGGFDVEILVVDDGSTDDTPHRVQKYADRVKYLRHEENLGVGVSSHEAVLEAKGEFFVRLDSDDFFSQYFLLHTLPFLRAHSSLDIVSTDIQMVNEVEFPTETVSRGDWDALVDFGAGVVFRKSSILKAGNYDKALRTREDLDLLIRMKKLGSTRYHVPLPLYRRRNHADNMSLRHEHLTEKERITGG